jgi:tetratricopeptide (TPR) repeat protein
MATLSKMLLVANTALVYLITLSWPESLFWSDVLASIYRAFSTSYVFDLAFGGLGIVAFLGLTRPTVLKFLNTITGRLLQVGAAVLLLFANLVGFAITPYTTINFLKIDLTGFKDAGLLAQWVRSSSDVAEPPTESERSELFAYAFFRELKRNNFGREQRVWYLGTESLVELIRPFEICVYQPAIDRCSRHKQTSPEKNAGWLEKIRNRHTELVLTGDVSIINEAAGHVFRVSLQSDRTTWRGQLPPVYLERTVDLPSEALSEVFKWLGTQGGFMMKSPITASTQELEYAKTIFFGHNADARGLTSYEAGEKALAEKLEKSPEDPGYNFLLGTAEIYTGKWNQAEQHLKKALRLAPESSQYIFFQLGLLEYYRGGFSAAVGYYAAVKDAGVSKRDVWATENLWWVRDRLALATWRAAFKEAQSAQRVFKRSNYKEAIEAAEADFALALQEAPPVGPTLVHFHAAQFFTNLGEFDATISKYSGVDSLYLAAAERVDGLVRSEVLYRHAESLRARGAAYRPQALEKYLESITSGQCGLSKAEGQAKAADGAEQLGIFALNGADICVGAGYIYSNVQPLAQFLLMNAEMRGEGDPAKAETSKTGKALAQLWTESAETTDFDNFLANIENRAAKGQPHFYPDIKVEVLAVLGNLVRLAGEESAAERTLRLSIKMESSLYNGEGRSIDFRFGDARLGLAKLLLGQISRSGAVAANASKHDEILSLANEGVAYSIVGSKNAQEFLGIMNGLN